MMIRGALEACSSESSSTRQRAIRNSNDEFEVEPPKRLLDVPVGTVDDLCRLGVAHDLGAAEVRSRARLYLPYHGLFLIHLDGEDVVGDPNQIVLVGPGTSLRMSGPIGTGYAALIVALDEDLLARIGENHGFTSTSVPRSTRRSWCASPRLHGFRAAFLHWLRGAPAIDPLEAQEILLILLRLALGDAGQPSRAYSQRTRAVIQRAKQYLAERISGRVHLVDVARAVGASPAYLTDLFRRVEGTSLHRYLTRLRLARALLELPYAVDLTALSIEIGFSSHSHFSAVFRRSFGITPSEFRERTRRAMVPTLAPPITIPKA